MPGNGLTVRNPPAKIHSIIESLFPAENPSSCCPGDVDERPDQQLRYNDEMSQRHCNVKYVLL